MVWSGMLGGVRPAPSPLWRGDLPLNPEPPSLMSRPSRAAHGEPGLRQVTSGETLITTTAVDTPGTSDVNGWLLSVRMAWARSPYLLRYPGGPRVWHHPQAGYPHGYPKSHRCHNKGGGSCLPPWMGIPGIPGDPSEKQVKFITFHVRWNAPPIVSR